MQGNARALQCHLERVAYCPASRSNALAATILTYRFGGPVVVRY
jgi:hypothetical protein